MEPFFITLTDAMTEIMELLQQESRRELEEQGHRLTGSLSESIAYKVTATDDKVVGVLTGNDYGVYLEFGVSPGRIPFGGGGAPGGKSKYIEGLIRFFTLKGLEPREAMRAAFATARVQKREGMPTKRSFQFSSNGKRTGFVTNAAESLFDRFAKIIENKIGIQLSLTIAPDIDVEPIKIFT